MSSVLIALMLFVTSSYPNTLNFISEISRRLAPPADLLALAPADHLALVSSADPLAVTPPEDVVSSQSQQELRFKLALQRMIHTSAPLLHVASDMTNKFRGHYDDSKCLDIGLVQLLLGGGAKVDGKDPSGDTPVHKVALSCVKAAKEVSEGKEGAAGRYASALAVLRVLLRRGSHMDWCNAARQTPAQLMGPELLAAVITELGPDVIPSCVPRLSCLAASAVASEVKGDRGRLSAAVEASVSMH